MTTSKSCGEGEKLPLKAHTGVVMDKFIWTNVAMQYVMAVLAI